VRAGRAVASGVGHAKRRGLDGAVPRVRRRLSHAVAGTHRHRSRNPGPARVSMDSGTLRQWLTDHEIDEGEAVVPDMAGVARGKYMPARKFLEQGGMRLPESVFIQSVTGSYLDNLDESVIDPADRDMLARPDLGTLRIVPWGEEPTASVIHDC